MIILSSPNVAVNEKSIGISYYFCIFKENSGEKVKNENQQRGLLCA